MEKQKKRVFSLKRSHLFYWCYIMVVTTWRTEENKRFINAFLIMPSLTPSPSVSFSLSSVRSTRVWLMLLLSPVREKRATICSWTIISRHSCRLSVHIYDAEIFLTLILVYCLAAKKSNTEMPNKVNWSWHTKVILSSIPSLSLYFLICCTVRMSREHQTKALYLRIQKCLDATFSYENETHLHAKQFVRSFSLRRILQTLSGICYTVTSTALSLSPVSQN